VAPGMQHIIAFSLMMMWFSARKLPCRLVKLLHGSARVFETAKVGSEVDRFHMPTT
jgi:hypothetical protein